MGSSHGKLGILGLILANKKVKGALFREHSGNILGKFRGTFGERSSRNKVEGEGDPKGRYMYGANHRARQLDGGNWSPTAVSGRVQVIGRFGGHSFREHSGKVQQPFR